jgi:hypothetical protein
MGIRTQEHDKMKEEKGAENKSDGIRYMGVIISSAPALIFRVGCWFVKFKRQANKGGRIFKKELLKQGFDKTNASILTDLYLKPSSLKQYMALLR